MSGWTVKDIPPQNGKFAIVTGANSGIGFDTALELARAGAEVLVASRNTMKGQSAVSKIAVLVPGAKIGFESLDLASLASITAFAERIRASRQKVDLLINNAGVMAPPIRQTTQDGLEIQLGVNYLGHFALTAHLLPLLRAAKQPRTVQLSSIAHKQGMLDFADFQTSILYKPWKAYSQSKLAMLMFALELQRRSHANGWGLLSLAAHPGVARTELVANGPGAHSLMAIGLNLLAPLITHSSAAGALPALFAATAPGVQPGGYYGPTGFMEMTGTPGKAQISRRAKDLSTAKHLWDISVSLTGVKFGL